MGVNSSPARPASTSMATSNASAVAVIGTPQSTTATSEAKLAIRFFMWRLWPRKRKRAGRREPARPNLSLFSEFRANAKEHAFAESLVADVADRIVELEALLIEEIHDIEERREVLVDGPAGRRVERAIVVVELRQAAATARRDEPGFTPVVRRANA